MMPLATTVAPDDLLMPGELARILRVDRRTISRWDSKGKFAQGEVIRTAGGHRRIRGSALLAMLATASRS